MAKTTSNVRTLTEEEKHKIKSYIKRAGLELTGSSFKDGILYLMMENHCSGTCVTESYAKGLKEYLERQSEFSFNQLFINCLEV